MDLALRVPLAKRKRLKPPSRETIVSLICLFISSLMLALSVITIPDCTTVVSAVSITLAICINTLAVVCSWRCFIKSWERDQRD